jgi:hypothetical protein
VNLFVKHVYRRHGRVTDDISKYSINRQPDTVDCNFACLNPDTQTQHLGGTAPNGNSFEIGKRSSRLVETSLCMDIVRNTYRGAV